MLSLLAAAQFAFAPSAVAPSAVAPSAVAPHARVVVGESGLDAVSAAALPAFAVGPLHHPPPSRNRT